MNTLKTVRSFYLVYTIYTFFVMAVSNYKAEHALMGLFSMWILYLAFSLGFNSSRRFRYVRSDSGRDVFNVSFPFSNIANWKNLEYLFNAIVCWICSVLSARFYTGRSFFSVITGLLSGTSGYAIYQRHLREANIGAFTLVKAPFFLMLVYCTAMAFWSMVAVLLADRKPRTFQVVYMLTVVLAYLYFGVARGTNYEMYIVFVSVVYCILNSPTRKRSSFFENRKRIMLVAGIGIVVVIVFRVVVESRGFVFGNQICEEITYDPNKLISRLFPVITTMALGVFRYLGWGIFSIGYMKWLAFGNITTIISILLPQGNKLLFNSSWDELTRNTIYVGVGWVPDYISLVDLLGIPLLLIVVYVVGRIVSGMVASNKPKLLVNLLGLFAFIEMLSIPVGNFIITSTPIVLSVFVCLLWYIKSNITSWLRRYRQV